MSVRAGSTINMRSAMNTTTESPSRLGMQAEETDPEIERIIRERRADKGDPYDDAVSAMAKIRKTYKTPVPG